MLGPDTFLAILSGLVDRVSPNDIYTGITEPAFYAFIVRLNSSLPSIVLVGISLN